MRIFLVGGAVRDMLLGVTPKDRDYVVVGATVEEFQRAFPRAKQIGKAFPVFQDTIWGKTVEFAFARKERKTGAGHNGFEVQADPGVTLEDDLSRRDLTINAMAVEESGVFSSVPLDYIATGRQVVDPFGGAADLQRGILRHVGPAFVEDPLRVYRVARFAARLGFRVAPETLQICQDVPRSELEALSGERVGQELRHALRSRHTPLFFTALEEMGALDPWFPELAALRGVPAGPPAHHQEGDSLVHTMLALTSATFGTQESPPEHAELVRWGALVHDLGKALTPRHRWPSHAGHDAAGVAPAEALSDRLKLPAWFRQAGALAAREHMRVHLILEMRKGTVADIVRAADATRLKCEGLAEVCMADACGKIPEGDSKGAEALLVAAPAARAEKGHPIPEGMSGEHIGNHVRNAKGAAIRRAWRYAGLIKGGPPPKQTSFKRERFASQPTTSFPDGPPQQGSFDFQGDLAYEEAAEAYAAEWRAEFRCVGCGNDPACPQDGLRSTRNRKKRQKKAGGDQ